MATNQSLIAKIMYKQAYHILTILMEGKLTDLFNFFTFVFLSLSEDTNEKVTFVDIVILLQCPFHTFLQ